MGLRHASHIIDTVTERMLCVIHRIQKKRWVYSVIWVHDVDNDISNNNSILLGVICRDDGFTSFYDGWFLRIHQVNVQ